MEKTLKRLGKLEKLIIEYTKLEEDSSYHFDNMEMVNEEIDSLIFHFTKEIGDLNE